MHPLDPAARRTSTQVKATFQIVERVDDAAVDLFRSTHLKPFVQLPCDALKGSAANSHTYIWVGTDIP